MLSNSRVIESAMGSSNDMASRTVTLLAFGKESCSAAARLLRA